MLSKLFYNASELGFVRSEDQLDVLVYDLVPVGLDLILCNILECFFTVSPHEV